jgi:hypothetical protein
MMLGIDHHYMVIGFVIVADLDLVADQNFGL